MNRTYLIGAGFSYDAGIPLQKDIIKNIYQIDTSSLNWEYSYITKYLKDFFDFIGYVLRGNEIENITLEDLFTLIDEHLNELAYLGKYSPQDIFYMREVVNDLVLFVINTTITDETLKLYTERVKKLINKPGTSSFISFNWDPILENVLIQLNKKINYGVSAELISSSNAKSGSILSNTKSAIKVIKPHGSLNWGICQTCKRITCSFDSSRLLNCPHCERKNIKRVGDNIIRSRLDPILLSPTFEKKTKILALKLLNQEFFNNMVEADEVIFIGYSLPISDHDIRMILMKTNIINPVEKIKVILKTDDIAERDRLKMNYLSIYPKDRVEFDWTGFN